MPCGYIIRSRLYYRFTADLEILRANAVRILNHKQMLLQSLDLFENNFFFFIVLIISKMFKGREKSWYVQKLCRPRVDAIDFSVRIREEERWKRRV